MAFILMTTTLLLTILTSIIYLYFKQKFNYFRYQNIPFLKPTFPLGNINLKFCLQNDQELKTLYQALKKQGVKYGGIYIATKPVLLLLDPELIKKILAKDFQYFTDRGIYCNKRKESISANLIAFSFQKGKKLRQKLTASFSNIKLKNMANILVEALVKLDGKLTEYAELSTCFDAKNLCVKITTNMFCAMAYGIECNALAGEESKLSQCANMFVENNVFYDLKLAVGVTMPKLFEKLNINLLKTKVQIFFIKAMNEIMEYREKNSINRSDLINTLIKLKNNISIEDNNSEAYKEGTTMQQLLAQCFIIFVGGFDTSSNILTFGLFELTQNQDLQMKIREEIYTVLGKFGGQVTYEAVLEMKLLHKFILETLRKYPPVVALNRKCAKNYEIGNVTIEKGTSITISILGLHHDPEFYPDPDKFNPERFSDEEKAKRHPYTYLPFAEGPKICIGMQLGLLQSKIGFIHLLKNHKYVLNSSTKLPLEFGTRAVLLYSNNKIWINVLKI